MSAIVQRTSGILSVGGTGIAFPAPVTKGNLLVAAVLSNAIAVNGISDAADNDWSVAAENVGPVANGFPVYIWSAVAKTTTSLTPIPATSDPSQTDIHVHMYEIAGYDSLDQTGASSETQTSNPLSVRTTGATKVAQEFVIAAFVDVGGDNPTDDWTAQSDTEANQVTLEPFTALFSECFEVFSAGAQTATASTPDSWADGCVIATFYSGAPRFLGSVRQVSGVPAGQSNIFLGTVSVASSAPAGATNPYLGHVNVLSSPPAGSPNPSLGEVVIVQNAPAGEPDPWLGSVVE